MRRIVKTSLLALGACVALAGPASAAEVLRTNIPFPFVVNNVTMPAGRYVVRRDDIDPAVMLIQGVQNHAHTYVITNGAAGHDPSGDKPCLTFKRTETAYRLTNVWESASEGRTLVGRE